MDFEKGRHDKLPEPFRGRKAEDTAGFPWNRLFIEDLPPRQQAGLLNRALVLEKLCAGKPGSTGAGLPPGLEEEVLERLSEKKDFVKPGYLVDWVTGLMNRHDRGVFLLQMEKGTGKTSFCRALDDHSSLCRDYLPPDCSVRVCFISEDTACCLPLLIQELYDILRRDRRGDVALGGVGGFDPESGSPRADMAEFLNRFLRAHRELLGAERLLLVLDGLSEYPIGNLDRRSLFGLIPEPHMLDEGLYILVTARTNRELQLKGPEVPRLADLALSESAVFFRNGPENTGLMGSFIETWFPGAGYGKKITREKLLNLADHRFLYLKVLRAMYLLAGEKELIKLKRGKSLAVEYLEMLSTVYEKHDFHRLVDSLVTCSLVPEPLSVGELACLLGEKAGLSDSVASFRLLAALVDLRCFLTVESGPSGSGQFLSATHRDWMILVENHYAEWVSELVEEWAKKALSLAGSDLAWWEEQYEGETYLLAIFYTLVCVYRPDLKGLVMEGRPDLDLLKAAGSIEARAESETLLERAVSMCAAAEEIWEELAECRRWQNRRDLAEIFVCRSDLLQRLGRPEEALHYLNLALEIVEQLAAQGRLENTSKLAMILLKRARALGRLDSYEKAFEDYDRLLGILLRLEEAGELEDRGSLALALLNRGAALESLNRPEEALECYNRAVRKYDQLAVEEALFDREDHAYALVSRGFTLTSLMRFEESLTDCDRAVAILQEEEASGSLPDRFELSRALTNRAIALVELGRPEEALLDFDDALEIMRALETAGRLDDTNTLVMARFNRGNILNMIGRAAEALADFEACASLMAGLSDELHVIDVDELGDIIEDARKRANPGE